MLFLRPNTHIRWCRDMVWDHRVYTKTFLPMVCIHAVRHIYIHLRSALGIHIAALPRLCGRRIMVANHGLGITRRATHSMPG